MHVIRINNKNNIEMWKGKWVYSARNKANEEKKKKTRRPRDSAQHDRSESGRRHAVLANEP